MYTCTCMFHLYVDHISYRSPLPSLPHVGIHTKFRGSRATRRHLRDDPREDVGEDVSVVECGLCAIVCVGETSDIVGVTSVGEMSCRRNVRTTP